MKKHSIALLAGGAALLLLSACSSGGGSGPAPSEEPSTELQKVTLGLVSPTANSWAISAAEEIGAFAENGVTVETTKIDVGPGMQAVASGSLNIMFNPADTLVSYQTKGGKGVAIVAQMLQKPNQSVLSRPELKSFADLRGKVVGTSSINSGSTVMLKRLLKQNGLNEGDYSLLAGGGAAQLYTGLQSGAYDAVWLNPPSTYDAQAAGFNILGEFSDVVSTYSTSCLEANLAWASSNKSAIEGFLKAVVAGQKWLLDPANKQAAIDLLVKETNASAAAAAKTYDYYIGDDAQIMAPSLKISVEGLENLAETMVEAGALETAPEDMTQFVDPSYLGAATGGSGYSDR